MLRRVEKMFPSGNKLFSARNMLSVLAKQWTFFFPKEPCFFLFFPIERSIMALKRLRYL